MEGSWEVSYFLTEVPGELLEGFGGHLGKLLKGFWTENRLDKIKQVHKTHMIQTLFTFALVFNGSCNDFLGFYVFHTCSFCFIVSSSISK